MKRSDIKQAFGGEVPFTKFIAEDLETSKRLLTAINLSHEDGYSVTPEEHTADSKRVDLVVRDTEGDVTLVIESQDASGWLDSIHASKITYYMYDRGCEDGVLICEDADEHIKGFVKWINDNTPLRLTLVSVVIFDDGGKTPHCEFIPLLRPSDIRDKKVRKVGQMSAAESSVADQVQSIYDNNPGLFTNVARNYISKTNVGGTGLTVAIHPYKTIGHFVEIWHAGKSNTETFRVTFAEVCKKNNLEPKFQNRRGYVNDNHVLTTDGAIDVFKIFVNALETKEITV
jgi:hypothetical protein